ncbi:MAG: hypothetical protein ACE147_00660 [Candidatus Methylomirabilales bacterium]
MATRIKFAEALLKIVADDSALNKQLAGIEKTVGEAGKRMASGMKTAMLAVTGAITAGAGGLALVLKTTADAGDQLAKMSQRVAIGTEILSGYKLAADLAGVELAEFGKGLQILSRNIVETSQGTGTAKDAFAALGIKVTDSGGKLKTAEQIMLEVADKFSKMEDGAKKTAYAMDIFGKSGANMIPMLNAGRAALEAQRKEAELFGATFNTVQAKAAEEFNDTLTSIGGAVKGFATMVGNYLIPLANEVLGRLLAKLKELAESGQLRLWAVQTAEAIVKGFVWAAQAVAKLAEASMFVVNTFRLIMAAAETLNATVMAVLRELMAMIGKVIQGAAWTAEKLGLSIAQPLRDAQRVMEDWSTTFGHAATQAADKAIGWWDAIGKGNKQAEEFATRVNSMAEAFEAWAGKAIAASVAAAAGLDLQTGAMKKAADQAAQMETITYEVNGQTRTMQVPKTPTSIWSGTGTPPAAAAAASALATPAKAAPVAASPAAAAAASASPEAFAGNYLKAWESVETAATRILDGLKAKARDAHSQVVESLYDVVKRRLIEDLQDEAARS